MIASNHHEATVVALQKRDKVVKERYFIVVLSIEPYDVVTRHDLEIGQKPQNPRNESTYSKDQRSQFQGSF